MSQKLEKLKTKLKELFQLDQPDLDFGLYRIMHAKSAEVTQFLDQDLLPQVREAFAQYQTADKAEIEKELAKAVDQARGLELDPEASPKVRELRARLAAVDIGALEGEVYDHLYSFFRRYYSEGDFLARRVYKPGVYAIPYEGEEVVLHWANKDQYYIKTSEYLRDYAFRLRPDDDENPMRVHFRLVDAAEGEHGNVKEAEGKERRFRLVEDEPLGIEEGELVVRFTYRPDPTKQKDLNVAAEQSILADTAPELVDWIKALRAPHRRADGTETSTRLRVHLDRYTARNTFDYFIHKDLGGFLRRELDFYIKNEVMHLDDVENESAPRVEQYLSKIKVIRRIAQRIIDFVVQLENFQKKLWLKKKFVVDTNYCITLDQIPEALFPEIAANDAQRKEWLELFGIDGIKGDMLTPGYVEPLSAAFLKANPTLVLDTRHFSPDFKAEVLASFEDIDAALSGVLLHSDSFQATRLLMARHKGQITTVYNDPPYNTDASEILYKNGYRSSSWCTLLEPLTEACHRLLADDGILCTTIDDQQFTELSTLTKSVFGAENVLGTVSVRSNPSGRITLRGMAQCHEYAIFCAKTSKGKLAKLPRSEEQSARFDQVDSTGAFEWRNFRRDGSSSTRTDRPKQFFPVFATENSVRIPNVRWDDLREEYEILEQPRPGETILWPIDAAGDERCWRWGIETARQKLGELLVKTNPRGKKQIYNKYRPNTEGVLPLTIWADKKYSSTEYGTAVVKGIFGLRSPFDFPKSIFATRDCLHVSSIGREGTVVDCFAGSGTTGHAVVSLNREDDGARRYLLIEVGAHFDSVLTPRMKKVIYAADWKDGRPVSRDSGVSHAFKIVRLESYEDTLNNLQTRRTDTQQRLLGSSEARGNEGLREQFVLRYMLDVETRGSQSLLNVHDFNDPTSYKLRIKRPGTDESREVNVDLLETFNYLLGLSARHISAPQYFTAEFERDSEKRLRIAGRLKRDNAGPWWFRTVMGTIPDGRKTLVIWRKRTGNAEEDNLVLDEWFTKQGYSTKDFEFQVIYVNGDSNLDNLKAAEDTWKVRLIEEDFHRLMFETEDA